MALVLFDTVGDDAAEDAHHFIAGLVAGSMGGGGGVGVKHRQWGDARVQFVEQIGHLLKQVLADLKKAKKEGQTPKRTGSNTAGVRRSSASFPPASQCGARVPPCPSDSGTRSR